MKKKRIGKVVAASLIVVLVAAIFGILKISSIDKYKGLVKVNKASLTSISTKLSANISDLSEDNNIEVKGYDEVDYNISYRLSEVPGERDVIINAKINENDQYATFKEVTGTDITSVLSADRKEITITLKNLPSNEEITSKVTMLIVNAPKGYTVRPSIRIKESTSDEYTTVAVRDVTVNTSSVQGTVIDEEGNRVPNIIIALKKNNQIIKETYTNSDGIYTLSDITPDTYSVVVNEENYEDLELNNLYIEDGNQLNLIVKKVFPYKIETNKYITKVELNNLGSKKDYLYNDVKLANIPVRKVNNLHGKIYYKITVQNTGEKAGIISSVKDELPEGLSFDEKLNSGYELKNGIIYNRNLEGIELGAGEQISDTLILTIENTDIAKTYINKVNARGELYEHVVYLLDGRTYKTLDVLEGETIDEPTVSAQNFSGWYTDETLTNKYKFELPVEKDLILYGVTAKKHTVKFNDKHPETLVETPYDEKEVNNGEPVTKPATDPEKEGYDFCEWTKDGVVWDFHTPVTEDLTLVSKYCIKSYKVEFYDKSASNGAEYEKIGDISKEYKSTLSNSEAPDLSNAWVGHNFLRWTTDQAGENEYDFTTLIKNNIKLYAQYSLQDRSFIFNDENRITEKFVKYGETVEAIADQGKEGHSFVHWSLEVNGQTPFDFSTPIYQTTTVYAVYQINQYHVIFNDTDPWTNVTEQIDDQLVNHGGNAIEPAEPQKEGHTFCGWKLNGNDYDFATAVVDNIILDSCYTKNIVNVYFMNDTDIWETKEVPYADKVTAPLTSPTKEHKIFSYWSEDGTTPFDYDTQIKEEKYLYSVFEDITPPIITHQPLYWTNDKVLVTISHASPVLTFKYKVDDGAYEDYAGAFELSTNSTIVAKSLYEDTESEIVSHDVTNIDKLNPEIGDITFTPSQTTILISGTMTDNQSGVAQIRVYRDNTTAGTINGTVIDADLRDYTKTKDMNIVVSELEPDTEYTFRIVVTDGAGNESEQTVTASTSPVEPICQIISVDGVDLNPDDYMPFTLLEYAIEDSHCDNKCTIQMLKSTNESVEILNTQDITLDLNGKTVAGILPGYTVNNMGEFTLIDNGTSTGGLINGNGIAVYNNENAKFTMGEGSSDPTTDGLGRTVSITAPYVFGDSYGVYSEHDALFSFFDGKVRGTNAIQGEVNETEYLYNATSSQVNDYEEVILAIQTEPEARINKSKYYSNINVATVDAKGGTSEIQQSQDSFLSGFTHVDTDPIISVDQINPNGFPFVYDAENDILKSGNQYYGSMAFTETIIDLTNYAENQVFEIEYYINPNVDGSKGNYNIQVYPITEDNVISSSAVYTIYNNDNLRAYRLAAGQKYKVSISYLQPVSLVKAEYTDNGYGLETLPYYNSIPESRLVITRASLHVEERTKTEEDLIDGNNKAIGFYYDPTTDTIRSDSQYDKTSDSAYAYGYYELDLTNYEGEYEINLTASLETYGNSYGCAYITEDNYRNTKDCYANSTNKMLVNFYSYSSSSYDTEPYTGYPLGYDIVGPYTGYRTLQGGKKYYLNLVYLKYNLDRRPEKEGFIENNIADQFIVNNIKIYKTGNTQDIDMAAEVKGTAFDFENPSTFNNVEYYGLQHFNNSDVNDSYIKIDLTDATSDKLFEFDRYGSTYYNYYSTYITTNNRALTVDEVKTNRRDLALVKDDIYATGNIYRYDDNSSYSYGGGTNKIYLEKGNVYYIHFNVRLGAYGYSYHNDEYDCNSTNGYCGDMISGMRLRDTSNTILNMGKLPINVGSVNVDNSEEESTTITQSTRDVVNPDGMMTGSYVWDSDRNMYVLAHPIEYYQAAGWTGEIDLTNETESSLYQFLYEYDPTGNLSIYAYYTVDELYPIKYTNYGNGPAYPEGYNYISTNGYITLEPGHKYYLYVMSYRNSTSNITTNAFRFDKVEGDRTKEYTKGEKIISFNEDVDEIQLLKDIQLSSSLVFDYDKEVILDLNGYKLTSNLSGALINNYGKLTIKDSHYENQTSETKTHRGILESTAGNIIKNNIDAELIIKNVRINIDTKNRYGIENYGNVKFADGYDSKIYVNALRAYGIYNYSSGRIDDTSDSIEIVMNYRNQAELSYSSLYKSLYDSSQISYYSSYINTGIYNSGYYNASGMKISGKHGTGFDNQSSGTAVIKTSNISVDINTYDKRLHDDYSAYNYRYVYTSRYGTDYYATITDYSIKNAGTMTLINSTNVGTRTYNTGQLFVTNGSTLDYLDNENKLVANNGAKMSNLLNKNSTIYFDVTEGVTNQIDNYGDLQLRNYNATSSTINNYSELTGDSINLGTINNEGNMRFVNGSSKYVYNAGTARAENFTVIADPDVHSENIKNSGILSLTQNCTIGDSSNPTTYGILMVPAGGGAQSNPYKQVELNIGIEGTTNSPNIYVYGKNTGIAGNCYRTKKNPVYSITGTGSNQRVNANVGDYFQYLNGDIEVLDQSNYDQDLCIFNMYNGYVTSIDNPNTPVKAVSIPINNTLDNEYTYFGGALRVSDKDQAISTNYTSNVVKIGNTDYISLQDAVDSITTDTPTTIDILWYTDVSSVVIPEGRNITLNFTQDHNSFVYAKDGGIINYGNLTVQGAGKLINIGKYAFINYGTITFAGGDYLDNWQYTRMERSLLKNYGTAIVNDGSISGLDLNNFGELTINNGSLKGTMVYGTGTDSLTTIKGGYFYGTDSETIDTYHGFKTEVKEYKTNLSWRHMIELNQGATAVIDGLNTETDTRYTYVRPIAHLDNSTLILKNSVIKELSSEYNPIRYISAEYNSNVIFESGTYENIYIDDNASKVTVTGGSLSAYSNEGVNYNLMLLHGSTPKAEVTGGELYSKKRAIGLSDFTNGYEIIIGTKGDKDENNELIVSKTSPSITGDIYSVAKYGSGSGVGYTGFFDGILKGSTAASDINFDEIEDDFEIIDDTETSRFTKYLDQKDLVYNSTTGVTYKSFQKAFSEATNGDQLETLRTYTNTKTTATIVIPETSNFTLHIKHEITVNNDTFIVNNGTAEFISYPTTVTNNVSHEGRISVNVASKVFVNNGTLTLKVNMDDLKSDGTNREVILNEEGATLNVDRSNITSVQRVIVNNAGTLNMNVGGTESNHTSTTFTMVYVPGDSSSVDYALVNTGTANINYFTLDSQYIRPILFNSGRMVVDHSLFNQTGSIINVAATQSGLESPVDNYNYLEIKNSNLYYVPSKINHDSVYMYLYTITGYYFNSSPANTLGNNENATLILDNNSMDTSVLGLVYQDGFIGTYGYDYDNDIHYALLKTVPNQVIVKNSELHNMAGVVQARGYVDIQFINNTFNIRDFFIQSFSKRESYRNYYDNRVLTIYAPQLKESDGASESVDIRSSVLIDGGTYNTNAYIYVDRDYTALTNETLTITTQSYMFHISPLEINCPTVIKDATINVSPLASKSNHQSYYSEYDAIFEEYIKKIEGRPSSYQNMIYTTSTWNWLGAVTTFRPVTVINSEISVTDADSEMPTIKGYSENAIITIGEKDGNHNESSPRLFSQNTGYPVSFYRNLGGVNFYDGVIETGASYGILVYNEMEDLDKHFLDKETDYIITGTSKKRYLSRESIIKNVTQDIEYSDINQAFSSVNSGDELEVLVNYVPTGIETYTINSKEFTLDLKGLLFTVNLEVSNASDISIVDTVGGGKVSSAKVYDTSELSINNNSINIDGYNSSIINIARESKCTINMHDNSVLNFENTIVPNAQNINANVNTAAFMYDDSSINITDSKIARVELNDNSTYASTCTTDDDLYVATFNNNSTETIEISCGRYGSGTNNGSVHIIGGKYGANSSIDNYGTTIFDGGGTHRIYNRDAAIVTINDGTFYRVNNEGQMTVNGGNITELRGGGILNITGGYIKDMINGSTTTMTGGIIGKYIHSGTFNLLGGKLGMLSTQTGTINIGVKDGIINSEEPEINTEYYYSETPYTGLSIHDGTILNFYDGFVIGASSPGAVTGKISDSEPGYKIGVVDIGDGKEKAYLTPITYDDSLVAMVNGINYNSLQQAINKSVLNCTSGSTCPKVTIFLNIELDADLTIASGYSVDINSNGYSISTNGFNVDPHITLDGAAIEDDTLGGNILNSLRGMLGLDETGTSVLVYEMADGSALSSENHYRLYEYNGSDYDLVTMEKGDEVARYNPGKGVTNMKPIKGRLYLTDLEPGNYKVTDDNGSEVTFTINDDGTLSGHVKEYVPNSNKIESTGEAKLLISLQTGIRKINYMLIAISLIAVLSVMFVLKRKSQNKNLV